MGYYTEFNGEIIFDKPVTLEDAKIIEEVVYLGTNWDDEGKVLSIYESMKWYDVKEDIAGLVKQLSSKYNMRGQIDCNGEEYGDIWRIVIKDNKVYVAQSEIVFGPTMEVKV